MNRTKNATNHDITVVHKSINVQDMRKSENQCGVYDFTAHRTIQYESYDSPQNTLFHFIKYRPDCYTKHTKPLQIIPPMKL